MTVSIFIFRLSFPSVSLHDLLAYRAFAIVIVRRSLFQVPLPLLPPADRLEAVAPEARVGRGLSLRASFAL
jgi:hypothetical protein